MEVESLTAVTAEEGEASQALRGPGSHDVGANTMESTSATILNKTRVKVQNDPTIREQSDHQKIVAC